ncbi:hypothetical protein ElyMa_001426100 [Elysia marginata]|uniref:Uncharacterized protein n=1 Tax=Elysia marginata TaxID=1093978 RepID=A0AAV4IWN9_9GAST|nr:hypothetical protein ElyMa_001426100 [Elysia marginata]
MPVSFKTDFLQVLEEVTCFFNKAVDDAEYQGKDVMRMYSKELEQTNVFCNYLSALSDALDIEVFVLH